MMRSYWGKYEQRFSNQPEAILLLFSILGSYPTTSYLGI
jgi:hypothetical protein